MSWVELMKCFCSRFLSLKLMDKRVGSFRSIRVIKMGSLSLNKDNLSRLLSAFLIIREIIVKLLILLCKILFTHNLTFEEDLNEFLKLYTLLVTIKTYFPNFRLQGK